MSDRATLDNVARALKDFYDRKNASIRDSPAPDHRLPQCEYCGGVPGPSLSCVHCGAPNLHAELAIQTVATNCFELGSRRKM